MSCILVSLKTTNTKQTTGAHSEQRHKQQTNMKQTSRIHSEQTHKWQTNMKQTSRIHSKQTQKCQTNMKQTSRIHSEQTHKWQTNMKQTTTAQSEQTHKCQTNMKQTRAHSEQPQLFLTGQTQVFSFQTWGERSVMQCLTDWLWNWVWRGAEIDDTHNSCLFSVIYRLQSSNLLAIFMKSRQLIHIFPRFLVK